jgi:predicted nucleic acid-binding protein
MRRRGRPPLPRVWSIDDRSIEVPREVVLDTSFVVEALIVSQPLHEPCLGYLLRLVEAETRIVFSHLLEMELYEATFQLALKERHPRYGLASYDAIHVATAIASGTQAAATLDAGFAAVPANELALYVDAGRIGACRKRRARPQ